MSEVEEDLRAGEWASWVTAEERRRTIFAAYIMSSLHNITYGIPPLILNHELNLQLPDYSQAVSNDPQRVPVPPGGDITVLLGANTDIYMQWFSEDAFQWQIAPRQARRSFQGGLHSLFNGSGFPVDASLSSFSSYILILGLLQQIYLDRRSYSGGISPASIEVFEGALRAWQDSWEGTDEPTLDPLSSKASFGLASSALLRLAYIRLNFNRGACHGVLWEDPSVLNDFQSVERSLNIERAVLHAAHAISVPVRLGISYMANTKTSIWSIEHSICSLESAVLLKSWLIMISTVVQASGLEMLRISEKKLLGIVTSIIKETEHADILQLPDHDPSRYRRMAKAVMILWSCVFSGIHILEIDDEVRRELRRVADSIQP